MAAWSRTPSANASAPTLTTSDISRAIRVTCASVAVGLTNSR